VEQWGYLRLAEIPMLPRLVAVEWARHDLPFGNAGQEWQHARYMADCLQSHLNFTGRLPSLLLELAVHRPAKQNFTSLLLGRLDAAGRTPKSASKIAALKLLNDPRCGLAEVSDGLEQLANSITNRYIRS